MVEWTTAADWDANQSEEMAVHEAYGAHTDTEVEWGLGTSNASLLHLWSLTETSGSTAYDHVGTANGTYTGPTLNDTTIRGHPSPFFDDVDDWIDLGTMPSATVTAMEGSASVGAVCIPASNSVGNIIDLFDRAIRLRISGGGAIQYLLDDGTNVYFADEDVTDYVGYPVIVFGTWDGATIKIFVNGHQFASDSFSGTVATAAGSAIGSRNGGGTRFWHGNIQHLSLWDGALTAAEVKRFSRAWFRFMTSKKTL